MDAESFDIREQMRKYDPYADSPMRKYDPYTDSPFQDHRSIDHEKMREGRFIDTMMLRMRGKEISYNEASHIIQEMLVHMSPEHAHRLVYDMSQRLQLLQDLCYDRSKEIQFSRTTNNDIDIQRGLKVKQEFLTRNDVEIK